MAKMENLLRAPPEKQIQQAKQVTCIEHLLNHCSIDSGSRNVDTYPENDKHRQGKYHFLTQLRNSKHIGQSSQHLNHLDFSTGRLILAIAALVKPCALTVKALSISPLPRTFRAIMNLFDNPDFHQNYQIDHFTGFPKPLSEPTLTSANCRANLLQKPRFGSLRYNGFCPPSNPGRLPPPERAP